jgi:hypothetical protein
MKEIIKDHIEMVKVLKAAPIKEVVQTVAFMVTIGTLFYFSILIFG